MTDFITKQVNISVENILLTSENKPTSNQPSFPTHSKFSINANTQPFIRCIPNDLDPTQKWRGFFYIAKHAKHKHKYYSAYLDSICCSSKLVKQQSTKLSLAPELTNMAKKLIARQYIQLSPMLKRYGINGSAKDCSTVSRAM